MRRIGLSLVCLLFIQNLAVAENLDPLFWSPDSGLIANVATLPMGHTLTCGASKQLPPGDKIVSLEFSENATRAFGTKDACEKAARDKFGLKTLCERHLEWFKGVPRDMKKVLANAQKLCQSQVGSSIAFTCAQGISVDGRLCDERRSNYSYHCRPYTDIACTFDEQTEPRISLKIAERASCEEIRGIVNPDNFIWELTAQCEFVADVEFDYTGDYGCSACPTH